MRKTFTMSPAQHAKLLEAMQPVPAMWIGGPPRSVQQNANDAWVALGQEMGFDGMTVRGIPGGSEFQFSAEEAPVTRPAPLPPGEAEYLSWRPCGVTEAPAPQFLFLAMDDDGKTHPEWLADEAAVLEAVQRAVFGGISYFADAEAHYVEADAIARKLLEDGYFPFEGDPPLHLFRVAHGVGGLDGL